MFGGNGNKYANLTTCLCAFIKKVCCVLRFFIMIFRCLRSEQALCLKKIFSSKYMFNKTFFNHCGEQFWYCFYYSWACSIRMWINWGSGCILINSIILQKKKKITKIKTFFTCDNLPSCNQTNPPTARPTDNTINDLILSGWRKRLSPVITWCVGYHRGTLDTCTSSSPVPRYTSLHVFPPCWYLNEEGVPKYP
jgi:hypothetical protein